jgi:hypothetical protein
MRYAWVCGFALLLSTDVRADEAPVKGLVVHEWGVFRVHQDEDLANADVLAEWRDLPDFIYGQVNGRVLPVNWGPTEIRFRPLVFFHATRPTQVRLRKSPDLPLEVRKRIDTLLEKWDAQKAFPG